MIKKTYNWSIYTRLFHILLIIGVALTYLLSDFDSFLSYHVVFGYFVAILLILRVIWGFMDVKYSKFKDFNFNVKDLIYYIFHIFSTKKSYKGHNPASSWAIVGMIIFAFLAIISGTLTYGIQEGMGILSFLNISIFKEMELFEEIHEFFSNIFMLIVALHVIGVLLDRFLNGKNSIDSMVNGYKISQGEDLKLTFFQKIFGILWIGLSILFLIYMLLKPSNILLSKTNNIPVDYQVQNQLFYDECISCHTLYPPFLLPSKSWETLMGNLENHFGDDASLEPEDEASILKYLVNNSANNSTKEASYYISKSIKNKDQITISKTPYWKYKHKDIADEEFRGKKVLSKANCKACHKNFEKGLLNDKDIKIDIIFNKGIS